MSLLTIAACGGSSGAGGEGTSNEEISIGEASNKGWITITYPAQNPFETSGSPLYISGEAFVSPTWWRCCTGDASDTGVTIVWRNEATGQNGVANQYPQYGWLFQPILLNKQTWNASIPIKEGNNLIVVSASDPGGNSGKETLNVIVPRDTEPPIITYTYPDVDEKDIDPATSLIIHFSESMDPASLTASSFTLKTFAGEEIDGTITISPSGVQAIFDPKNSLLSNGTYIVTLTIEITDLNGLHLANEYVWMFETGEGDIVPPNVVNIFPFDGAKDVSLHETIRVQFSEPVLLYSAVTTDSFQVRDSNGSQIPGVFSGYETITFTPSNLLAQNSTYFVELTTGITDLAGNAMENDYTWSFTTTVPDTIPPEVTLTFPENNATGVAIDGIMAVKFNESINQSSLNTSTFLLKDSYDNPISGFIWDGKYFRPSKLSLAEEYTAMITTEVTDLAGNPLAANYTWKFTTTSDGTGTWTATSTTNAPSPRNYATSVWTGEEMIVWGGYNGSYLNSGGRYNPVTDSWQSISTVDAPGGCSTPVSVWTGQEMIVWCGRIINGNKGGRYNPSTDTWIPMATLNAPNGLNSSTAVWTGEEMIVWGGYGSTYSNIGGRYNPVTDMWVSTSLAGAPAPRVNHTAVWTGSEMIVWGGDGGPFAYIRNTGGRYNPDTDSWNSMSNIAAPYSLGHVAHWTGNAMLIWGSDNGSGTQSSTIGRGDIYNPFTDSWSRIASLDALVTRDFPLSVWTGNEFILWGGYDITYKNSGGCYEPAIDNWNLITFTNAPSGREKGVSVWTGSEFIVWGGVDSSGTYTNTGGRYSP